MKKNSKPSANNMKHVRGSENELSAQRGNESTYRVRSSGTVSVS